MSRPQAFLMLMIAVTHAALQVGQAGVDGPENGEEFKRQAEDLEKSFHGFR